MKLKQIIINNLIKILHPNTYSSEVYVKYLRKNGAKIGNNNFFTDPPNINLDSRRLQYITIGNNCCITRGVEILCHDFSWSVLIKSHNEILPDCGKPVTIGDNVFIGWDSIIMGDVNIGSNVIVGAHSVVTHDIPNNCVVAGNPARVIMTIDEYYQKKKKIAINDAVKRAKYIYRFTNNKPTVKDMGWFGVLFLDRNKENEKFLKTFKIKGIDMNKVIDVFYSTKKEFEDFESFLKYAFKEKNN